MKSKKVLPLISLLFVAIMLFSVGMIVPGTSDLFITIDNSPLATMTHVSVVTEQVNRVENIFFEQPSCSLYVGTEKTLNPIVVPEDATSQLYVWKSNDETVATVDENGTVRGISDGTCVITAQTVDGKNTAFCSISVSTGQNMIVWVIGDTCTVQYLPAGAAVIEPMVLEKTGYYFSGWSSEVPDVMPAENLVFTALYLPNEDITEDSTDTQPDEPGTEEVSEPESETTDIEPVTSPIDETEADTEPSGDNGKSVSPWPWICLAIGIIIGAGICILYFAIVRKKKTV